MALTAETVARHELRGLHTKVAAASNGSLVGIEGDVVSESENTLVVEQGGRTKRVPKAGATFEFALGDGAEGAEYATVAGERLVAPPARRTETTGDSKWR
ncbi:ribonuclease P protein component 1 [Halococcus sp. AFM35]|uniref:ribonuclease P protein component 1 n=1 Tax=Halococcus sp. AFM35 TaxID=3421653 RepID=UPI003EBBCEA7